MSPISVSQAGGDDLKEAEKRLSDWIRRRVKLTENTHGNYGDTISSLGCDDGSIVELNLSDLRLVLNL